jgi:hypothetical protein
LFGFADEIPPFFLQDELLDSVTDLLIFHSKGLLRIGASRIVVGLLRKFVGFRRSHFERFGRAQH